jgi:hypothetical protein
LIGRPFDPAGLLDAAADAKIPLRRDGQADVDGRTRARFVASIEREQARTLGVNALTVYTDDDGLPVRFDVVALSGADGSYTVAAGTAAVAVEEPPSDQIEPREQVPTATGDYEEVASGAAGDATYRVLRAAASKGWACWKVESEPRYVPTEEPGDDGGLCRGGIETSGDPVNQIAIPLDASRETPYELLGLQVPPGTSTVMHLADGSERPVAERDGLAIYAGSASPAAALAVVTLPDGAVMYCAPGEINTLSDLADLDAASGEALRDQPWNCLEKELAEALG